MIYALRVICLFFLEIADVGGSRDCAGDRGLAIL